MNTKLTLTIEQEVIQIAKDYAKEHGQSLSNLVENYLKLITVERRQITPEQLSPKVKKLRGIIQVDGEFDYKKTLEEEISMKNGF